MKNLQIFKITNGWQLKRFKLLAKKNFWSMIRKKNQKMKKIEKSTDGTKDHMIRGSFAYYWEKIKKKIKIKTSDIFSVVISICDFSWSTSLFFDKAGLYCWLGYWRSFIDWWWDCCQLFKILPIEDSNKPLNMLDGRYRLIGIFFFQVFFP